MDHPTHSALATSGGQPPGAPRVARSGEGTDVPQRRGRADGDATCPGCRSTRTTGSTTEEGEASLRDLFGGCCRCSSITSCSSRIGTKVSELLGRRRRLRRQHPALRAPRCRVRRGVGPRLRSSSRTKRRWDFRGSRRSAAASTTTSMAMIDPAVVRLSTTTGTRRTRGRERRRRDWSGEQPRMSVFAREGDDVFDTYSGVCRGFYGLWPMWQWLDRAPRSPTKAICLVPSARRIRGGGERGGGGGGGRGGGGWGEWGGGWGWGRWAEGKVGRLGEPE